MPEPERSVAVAIPAYNEEGIHDFIREIDEAFASTGQSVSIYVVDDCSTDDTYERAAALTAALRSKLHVSRNPQNMGHGPTAVAAYRRALESGSDYVVQVDGDGQFDAAEIRHLIGALDDGADVAAGVRRHRVDPWFRKLLSLLLRLYLWLVFRVRTRDANCPFRAYRRDALMLLLDGLPADVLVPNVYLSALAAQSRLRIVPVEVEHRERRGVSRQGTMWGRRSVFIPKRLILFVLRALSESFRFGRAARQRGAARLSILLTTAVLMLGIVARFAVASRGHNWDFESYRIVADIVTHGGTVYRDTPRYNYGPVWFWILGVLYHLTVLNGLAVLAFRYSIVALLTAGDLAIATLLRKRYGTRVATIFFLNPVTIIITGYHSQFDNLAILLGLLAVLLLAEGDGQRGMSRRELAGLVVLGFSLMVKHVLAFLPLWIAFRKPDVRSRVIAIAVPVSVFFVGFAPFLSEARQGVVDHVFKYRSYENAPLVRLIFGSRVPGSFASVFFAVVIIAAGWVVARKGFNLEASFAIHLILLVALAPAVANQYLAIPMVAIATMWNGLFAAYVVYGTLFLAKDFDGLHYEWLPEAFGRHGSRAYSYLCLLLIGGLGLTILRWARSSLPPFSGSRVLLRAGQPLRRSHADG